MPSQPTRPSIISGDDLVKQYQQLAELAAPHMVTWASRLARSHIEHYRTVFSFVNRIAAAHPVGRIVDVGSVPGFIPTTLRQSGFDVEAVDIDPSRTQAIFDAAGMPCHRVDVEVTPLPFADASIDLVLFNEILEHLRVNPIFALREVARIVKPGGSILLSVPNITPMMRWRFLRGHDYQGDVIQEFKKLETVGHMGHFRLYSRREVEYLTRYVGLKPVVTEPHGAQMRWYQRPWRRKQLKARLFWMVCGRSMCSHLYMWARRQSES